MVITADTDPATARTIELLNHSLLFVRTMSRIDLTEDQREGLAAQRDAVFEDLASSAFVPGDTLRPVLASWPAWCLRGLLEGIRFRASAHLRDSIAVAIRVAEDRTA
jgi:hypothetical protein